MVPPVLEAGFLSNPHLLERQSVESKISNYILVPDQSSRQRKPGEERSAPGTAASTRTGRTAFRRSGACQGTLIRLRKRANL